MKDLEGLMEKTDPNDPIIKSLRLLENDVDALGWDGAPRLYAMEGDVEDPVFKFVSEVPGHPADSLEELYERGMRPPIECHGLVISTEAWRSITLQEAEERGLVDLTAEREEHKDDWDEWLKEAGTNFVQNLLKLGPIASFPEPFKVETRNVTAVLRDGTVYILNHDRDGEISAFKAGVPASQSGRVPAALAKLLEPVVFNENSEETWVVVVKNADGSNGEILQEFPNEFEAKRFLIAQPGHSQNRFAYGPKSDLEDA